MGLGSARPSKGANVECIVINMIFVFVSEGGKVLDVEGVGTKLVCGCVWSSEEHEFGGRRPDDPRAGLSFE